ncbi:MAG: M28 family peptidase [Bacteroidia bacterium]|nr:M28 family peptidase [Bacteroidia bacterium]
MQIRILSLLFFSIFYCNNLCNGQQLEYAQKVINKLCSNEFEGRGYVNLGDRLAANYISSQFELNGLQKFGENYFQFFDFSVNTFPGTMDLIVDGKELYPGVDYLIHPASKGGRCKATCIIVRKPPGDLKKNEHKGKWLVVDKSKLDSKDDKRKMDTWLSNPGNAEGVIVLEEKKLTWHVSREVKKYPIVVILQDSWNNDDAEVELKLKNKFEKKHHVPNVLGYVKGSKFPEKYIVFSAHYDHLGRMGQETIFPGANDNASGVSMLLNMARHFAQADNQPEHSILFIAFAGEEAGLVGSAYYTQHPIVELEKMSFLINLDLLGTGDEGMMVVNGKIHQEEFEAIKTINDEKKYLPIIKSRGKAANSDHYYFSEKGVPSFFFYTLGGIEAYHDVNDIADTLPLTEYEDLFNLILDFHRYLDIVE